MSKVSKATVDAILATATIKVKRVSGTLVTGAWVFVEIGERKDFYLAYGESICADPSEFTVEEGEKWAKEEALKTAEDKLWGILGSHLAITGKHLVV